MEKLNFQDAAFLHLENHQRPWHVGGLLLLSPPAWAPRDYLRRLATTLGRELPRCDPLFMRQLANPAALVPQWTESSNYDPAYHVHHYSLPAPGRSEELLGLVSRVHERVLDRSRPLWEWHLIEGLPRGRFALYCKIHHALVDGVGAVRLLDKLLSEDPHATLPNTPNTPNASNSASPRTHGEPRSWLGDVSRAAGSLIEQGRALPELATLFRRMQAERAADTPPLPFTAPHAVMNTNISHRRRVVIGQFPLSALRRIGAAADGTVNDALLAICGGALRRYLTQIGKLPERDLLAGIPVSVKDEGDQYGNQLGMTVCPVGTTTRDPLGRLKSISRVTRQAKADLHALSQAARQDYMNMILLPTLVFTLARSATAVPPPFNVIVSNVPGPTGVRYLLGARLEEIYPLSVVTDAQALNVTAISLGSRVCVCATSCPDNLPEIAQFDTHLLAAYRELNRAIRK